MLRARLRVEVAVSCERSRRLALRPSGQATWLPLGLRIELDDRLGYDAPDLAGWVHAAAREHPGEAVVGVSHGDLIPLYLLRAGLVGGAPDFRTGSLFRLEAGPDRVASAVLVDRKELKRQAERA